MSADVDVTDDGILVTLTGRFDRVDGWAESREDLGLNTGGPDPVEGVTIDEERPVFYDDEREHIAGYSKVVLRFDDVDALEAASDRLYDKATERFEWGMAREAEKVQDLAGTLPSEYDVTEATA